MAKQVNPTLSPELVGELPSELQRTLTFLQLFHQLSDDDKAEVTEIIRGLASGEDENVIAARYPDFGRFLAEAENKGGRSNG